MTSPFTLLAADPGVASDAAPRTARPVALERLLGWARLLTAAILFAAIAAGTGSEHPAAAKFLMGGYIAYALALIAICRTHPLTLAVRPGVIHTADFVWATVVTTISGGVSSHLFPLFGFLLVAASARWGLRRTLVDGLLIVGIAAAESSLALAGLTSWPFELDWFLVWAVYMTTLGVVLGVLYERINMLSAQALAIGRLMTQISRAPGLTAAIRCTLREALHLFGSGRGLLVVQEADSDRVFVWRAQAHAGGTISVSLEEPPRAVHDVVLFPVPAGIVALEARRRGYRVDKATCLLPDGTTRRRLVAVPEAAAGPWGWNTMLAVMLDSSRGFVGRLYLLDPTRPATRQFRLDFLSTLGRQATSGLVDLYLVRGLRARVESGERARLARELHDGIVQSLAGAEMWVEVLRRRSLDVAPSLEGDLASIRDLLRAEAVTARNVMQRLRQAVPDARQLPHDLKQLVERFTRESGVETQLAWTAESLELTASEAREVATIAHEALINVRRHSRATRASVRVESDASGWMLIVEDNGTGMGFTGTRSHEELERRGAGPRVIRERVADMGGRLTVTSSPAGTRLEIAFQAVAQVR